MNVPISWANINGTTSEGTIPVNVSLRVLAIVTAGLEKEVLIIGMVNKMEVWNPKYLKNTEKDTLGIDSDAYEDLAGKITIWCLKNGNLQQEHTSRLCRKKSYPI